MGTDSVVIKRCASLPEAYACLGLLQSHSIFASVDNAHHAAMDWTAVPALGGISIRVPISQSQDASSCIANAIATAAAPSTEPAVSKHWTRIKAMSMLAIYLGLIQFVGALVLIPLIAFIPESWIPDQSASSYSYYDDGGVPLGADTLDGFLLLVCMASFLLYEMTSTRPRTNPDPEE